MAKEVYRSRSGKYKVKLVFPNGKVVAAGVARPQDKKA